MARQQIAQDWKIVQTLRDPKTLKFSETTAKLGKFTAYTAHSKMAKRFPEYRYVAKPFHGFGGYWVDQDGNTAECLPA